MLMYCKIKIAGLGTLTLPKANSLECGCMMPLKHTKVETLVGKGVFKVKCQKEELILYSADGRSEEWVDTIQQTIQKHKADAATLRKESSRRDALRRPQILKMRRDSLSQIMMSHSKQQMTTLRENSGNMSPRRFGALLSPLRSPLKKKRQAPDTPSSMNVDSPNKLKRVEEEAAATSDAEGTPRRSARQAANKENSGAKASSEPFVFASPKPLTRSAKKKMAPPPPPPQTPPQTRETTSHLIFFPLYTTNAMQCISEIESG